MAGYNAAMRKRGQSESGGQQPVQSESAMLAGKSEMVQTKQIVVEEQQIVQTKQAEVAAESVTMPENIKAAGQQLKYLRKHNICSKKHTEPMQRRRILLKSFLCGLII